MLKQMEEAIKSGDLHTDQHKDLGLIYSATPRDTRHIINMMITRQARDDLVRITEALSLIKYYESAGVGFNFINYKTVIES